MDYGTLIQLAMSMYGEQAAKNMTAEQLRIFERQVNAMEGLQLPDLQQLKPEQLGPSASGGIEADPHTKQTEEDVLAEMGNLYGSGGLDFRDKASLAELLDSANQQAQSQQAGIRQQLQGTGQLGSGADIAMRMGAAQGAAQRGGDAAMKQASIAAGRRMDLLHSRGSMASSMRGEDFNERMRAAAARDAREQWNAASREKAGYYNAGLPQQQFNNRLTKITGSFAPGSNLAAAYGNEAQGQRSFWSGLGASAKYGADAYGRPSGGGSGGDGGPHLQSDDPNWTYRNGTDYGGSDPNDWENPYGGW